MRKNGKRGVLIFHPEESVLYEIIAIFEGTNIPTAGFSRCSQALAHMESNRVGLVISHTGERAGEFPGLALLRAAEAKDPQTFKVIVWGKDALTAEDCAGITMPMQASGPDAIRLMSALLVAMIQNRP